MTNTQFFIAGFIVGLIIGVGLGYLIPKQYIISFKFKYFVGASVTVIWIITMLFSIFDRTYTVPVIVHGIFGGIVTSLFGESALENFNKK